MCVRERETYCERKRERERERGINLQVLKPEGKSIKLTKTGETKTDMERERYRE